MRTMYHSGPSTHWRSWESHGAAKSLFDSNHDGMRALLIVLFYGFLLVLYGFVCLGKTLALALGFAPPASPKELTGAPASWPRQL